jgi:hypothetical protein
VAAKTRLIRAVEGAVWLAAVVAALIFAALRIASWGGPVAAPEQRDFATYWRAAHQLAESPEAIYAQPAEFQGAPRDTRPYRYTPVFAWLMQPLGAVSYELARRLWFWSSLIAIAATVGLLAWVLPGRATWLGLGLWLVLPATLDTLHHGQVNFHVALVTAAIFVAWGRASIAPALGAGALLGLTAGVKPAIVALGAIAPWGSRRRVLGAAIGGGLLAIVASLAVSPQASRAYVASVVRPTSHLETHPAQIINNQSLPAFWRKLSLSEPLPLMQRGTPRERIEPAPWLSPTLANLAGWSSALIVLGVTVAIWVRRRHDIAPRSRLLLAALASLAGLLLSPLSWTHYSAASPLAFVGLAVVWTRLGAGWRLTMAAGFALLVAQRAAPWSVHHGPWLVVSSFGVAGLGLCWASLAFGLSLQPDTAPPPLRPDRE